MTCKEAYFKTLWYKIPFEIRHAIEDAIVEGNFSIKMEKENSSSDKDELDDKIIPILNQLGYTVRWTDPAIKSSSTTYSISWK